MGTEKIFLSVVCITYYVIVSPLVRNTALIICVSIVPCTHLTDQWHSCQNTNTNACTHNYFSLENVVT